MTRCPRLLIFWFTWLHRRRYHLQRSCSRNVVKAVHTLWKRPKCTSFLPKNVSTQFNPLLYLWNKVLKVFFATSKNQLTLQSIRIFQHWRNLKDSVTSFKFNSKWVLKLVWAIGQHYGMSVSFPMRTILRLKCICCCLYILKKP